MSCLPASALAQSELIYCNVFWPEQTFKKYFGRAPQRGDGLPMVYMEMDNETHGVLLPPDPEIRQLPKGCFLSHRSARVAGENT